jgi:hypothetical protein
MVVDGSAVYGRFPEGDSTSRAKVLERENRKERIIKRKGIVLTEDISDKFDNCIREKRDNDGHDIVLDNPFCESCLIGITTGKYIVISCNNS